MVYKQLQQNSKMETRNIEVFVGVNLYFAHYKNNFRLYKHTNKRGIKHLKDLYTETKRTFGLIILYETH